MAKPHSLDKPPQNLYDTVTFVAIEYLFYSSYMFLWRPAGQGYWASSLLGHVGTCRRCILLGC